MRTLIATLAALAVATAAFAGSSSDDGQAPAPKHTRAPPHCHAGVSKQCGKACIPLKRTCNLTSDEAGADAH